MIAQAPQMTAARRPAHATLRPHIEALEDRAVPALNLPSNPFLFTPVSMMAPLAMHIHAQVHIFLDGQPIVIPANVGAFGFSAYPLHTHDASGLIHMESPILTNFNLQDFFAIWNTTLQGHAALAQLDAALDVTVTINGTTNAGLGLVPLHDHDDIVIQALSAAPNAAAAANELFVTKLYADLLHRPPDMVGLVGWTTGLDQGQSRIQVAQAIEASPESQSLDIQVLYRSLLHRDADPNGLAWFTALLAAGGTMEQAANYMLASPEYFQRAGGTNAGFVAALYNDLLQRSAQTAEIAGWLGLLTGGQTRGQVAAAIFQSAEAEIAMLQGIYHVYLHRPADDPGLASFLAFLQRGGTREQVLATVLGSVEYLGKS